MTICDTVTVTVAHTVTGEVVFSLPAYTRSPVEVGAQIAEELVHYLNESARRGQPTSLADFVLYMIAIAAQEPREQ